VPEPKTFGKKILEAELSEHTQGKHIKLPPRG
jgi:hypothetical protein